MAVGAVGLALTMKFPAYMGASCEVWGKANQLGLDWDDLCPDKRQPYYGSYSKEQEEISRHVDACRNWRWEQEKKWREAKGEPLYR